MNGQLVLMPETMYTGHEKLRLAPISDVLS